MQLYNIAKKSSYTKYSKIQAYPRNNQNKVQKTTSEFFQLYAQKKQR